MCDWPFQDVGLTIVSQKALRDDQTALGFLKSSFHILAPIDVGVWAVFALAVFVVSRDDTVDIYERLEVSNPGKTVVCSTGSSG